MNALKMTNLTETEIQSDILTTLHRLHIGLFWRNNNTGVYDKEKGVYRRSSPIFQRRGVSDILGCYDSKFTAIEVKTLKAYKWVMHFWNRAREKGDIRLYKPTNKHEDHVLNQILFLEDVRRYGGVGFFTYSTEDTIKKLGVKNVSFGNGICQSKRIESGSMESETDIRQGIFGFEGEY